MPGPRHAAAADHETPGLDTTTAFTRAARYDFVFVSTRLACPRTNKTIDTMAGGILNHRDIGRASTVHAAAEGPSGYTPFVMGAVRRIDPSG